MADDIVLTAAVRTPIGRRDGGLATFHSADLLGTVQREAVARAGIEPGAVDQVFGGVIGQVGQQAFNVTRTAWLTAGLPIEVPATTMDSQCGSSQQATTVAHAFLAGGLAEVAVACGVEVMSKVPLGAGLSKGVGKSISRSYFAHHRHTTQFEAAELIAEQWDITRDDADALGLASQQRAAVAVEEGRFAEQILPVDAPVLGDDGKPTGATTRIATDEALRPTTAEGLAGLKALSPDGVHTAGTSSQIADAAAAVVLMTAGRADALGVAPRARVVDSCLIAGDPVLNLTGPIAATRRLLEANGLGVDDIDVFEVNEAFASVVLSWQRELEPDPERVNPNGGAIALGHALGSTGAVLLTKALHELERTGGRYALITMCCGGGLATGTILERA